MNPGRAGSIARRVTNSIGGILRIFIVPLELLRRFGGVVRLAYHSFVLALMLVSRRIVVINGAGRRVRDRKIRRYSYR